VAKSAVLLDPRSDDRAGVAAVRKGETGSAQVYLQLQPGESCIIRTFTDQTIAGTRWNYLHPTGAAQPIAGTWKVQFIEGGPALPPSFETQTLASWTTLGQEPSRFAGTARYTITFDHPPEDAADWVLDLGKVCESARVKVNDHAVHGFWCAPFRMNVGQWLVPGKNTLDVEVTNLAINRIADMDRHHQNWKYFYDANVATHLGRGVFDASKLPPRDSGLLGPVQLIPMARTEVATTGR